MFAMQEHVISSKVWFAKGTGKALGLSCLYHYLQKPSYVKLLFLQEAFYIKKHKKIPVNPQLLELKTDQRNTGVSDLYLAINLMANLSRSLQDGREIYCMFYPVWQQR